MKSFLSGRPTAPIASLKPLLERPTRHAGVGGDPSQGAASGASAGHGGVTSHAHQPSVECVKKGDKVTHLIVTCACGERIEIDCLYAGPA